MCICYVILLNVFSTLRNNKWEKQKSRHNRWAIYCDIYLCKTTPPTQSTSQSLFWPFDALWQHYFFSCVAVALCIICLSINLLITRCGIHVQHEHKKLWSFRLGDTFPCSLKFLRFVQVCSRSWVSLELTFLVFCLLKATLFPAILHFIRVWSLHTHHGHSIQ